MTTTSSKARFGAKGATDTNQEADQSRIGSLRSSGIKIELHTKFASRIWKGRLKSEQKDSIIGIPRFAEIMRTMENAIREDDPYADYWFHEIEKKLAEVKHHIEDTINEVEGYIREEVPPGMSISDNMSQEPQVIELRIKSKLGYQAVYCLLEFDKLASKILLGNHIAVIDNATKGKLISHAERLIRGALNLAYRWRYTGVTRDDLVSNTAKARKAIEKMDVCPDEYLSGEVRSKLAPELPLNRKSALVTEEPDKPAESKGKKKATAA